MALVVKDRVKETTTSTGTGAITLGGAADNFVTFSSVLSDTDTTYYAIVDDGNDDFEVGLGTYASGGNTLTRTTVLASSNAGSAVNLQAGEKNVFITYPADKSVYLDAAGDLVGQTIKTFTLSGGTADGTTIGGTIAAAGTFTTVICGNLTANGTFTSTGIDDNAVSTAITIDSSQQIGIGTAAPANLVDIVSGDVAPTLRIQSTNGVATNPTIKLDGSNDGTISMSSGGVGGLSIQRDGGAQLLFKNSASEIGVTGTFTNFASTGIDDNATSTAITIDSSGTVQFQNAIEEQQYSLTGTVIDPSNGTIQYKTLSANTTFTESLADGEYVTLMIDDGSAYTVTWPTTTWVGGSAPTLETTGYNVIELWQVNGTLYGAFVGAA